MEPAQRKTGQHSTARDQPPAPARLAQPTSSGASGAAAPLSGPRSPALHALRDDDALVHRVARSRVSVVITGETGVGKDLLARRLHELSSRAGRPFIALNCAAISDGLLESELFGHQRGAFTGADSDKPGLIEAADGGTFFLDELGELPPSAQAKLLRVIETRAVHRVGALVPRELDVRFVAATNRPLEGDIAAGRFRADLLFRLDGIRLTLPPLRERPAEIVPAAERFLTELAARDGVARAVLGDAARRELHRHSWPGNFRELRNVIERAALLCEGGRIEPRDLMLAGRAVAVDLPLTAALGGPARNGAQRDDGAGLRERILAALKAHAGNQTRAAGMLGVSRRTLINWLEAQGIPRPRKRVLKVLAGKQP